LKKQKALLLTLILVTALPLLASGSGEEGGGGHHFNWADFLGRILNSTVLFGGLWFLMRKPAGSFLESKSIEVRNDIEGRREKIKQAEQNVADLKNRVDLIQDEIRQFLKEASENATREKQEIVKNAGLEAERLEQLVREMVANELGAYLREVKGIVIDEAVRRFREKDLAKMSEADHSRIIDRNIEECARIENG
jgi:F-type H+-transporting ATPase subunit b